MSLYTIDQELKARIDSLYDQVDENGELKEVTIEDLKAIEELNQERQTKLENIALFIKNLDAEADAIKAEEESLKARRERIQRKADGLRNLMMYSLMANGDTESSSPRYHAKIRETEATDILNEDLIPEEFMKVKIPDPVRNPDKVAIKKAIKAGQEVPGAVLKVNRKLNIE